MLPQAKSLPVEGIVTVARVPQVLQEAKHDMRGPAASAVTSLARGQA